MFKKKLYNGNLGELSFRGSSGLESDLMTQRIYRPSIEKILISAAKVKPINSRYMNQLLIN